jgi:hypothetical protein
VYYTKKQQDAANFYSTRKGNKGLSKQGKMKMSPFYVEDDTSISRVTVLG